MNIAFVGFKHAHTGALYKETMSNPEINVLGAEGLRVNNNMSKNRRNANCTL